MPDPYGQECWVSERSKHNQTCHTVRMDMIIYCTEGNFKMFPSGPFQIL